MSSFPDYLRDTKILSLSTFIAAFTYGYIGKISKTSLVLQVRVTLVKQQNPVVVNVDFQT